MKLPGSPDHYYGLRHQSGNADPRGQMSVLADVDRDDAEAHGDQEIGRLVRREMRPDDVRLDQLSDILHRRVISLPFLLRALRRGCKPGDGHVEDQVVEVGMCLGQGHSLRESGAEATPVRDYRPPQLLFGIPEETDSRAIQHVVECHLARKVGVEGRRRDPHPASDLVQVECGDNLLAHDIARGHQNACVHLFAVAPPTLVQGEVLRARHLPGRHPLSLPEMPLADVMGLLYVNVVNVLRL